MSNGTALTVIAVSLVILAMLGLIAVAILFRLVRISLILERSVVREISDLRAEIQAIVHHARDTSQKVSQSLNRVRDTTRIFDLLASGVGSWLLSRARGTPIKMKPWWMSGLALGWTVYKNRRRKAKARKNARAPLNTPPST